MLGGIPQEHGEKIADFATYQGGAEGGVAAPGGHPGARHRDRRPWSALRRDRHRRLGYAAAAVGSMNGILRFCFAIFVLGTPNAAIQLFIGVMLVGIAVGMLMSLITY
jgi:hypothetical protein